MQMCVCVYMYVTVLVCDVCELCECVNMYVSVHQTENVGVDVGACRGPLWL